MCPFLRKQCIKEKCKLWQEFENTDTKEKVYGCAFLWTNILLIELKNEINKSKEKV